MVFYFSGTGNSLAIAKRIAQRRGEQLVDIAKSLRDKHYSFITAKREPIAIVCPIYYWGLPTVVISFLERVQLPGRGNPFIYAVFTCGGSIGITDRQLTQVLDNRGYELGAAYSIKMPDNFILSFNLLTPESEVPKLLEQAYARLEHILDAVEVRRSVEHLIHRGRFPRMASTFAYPIYKCGRSTEPFFTNSSCNGCGQCERNCPIGAIKLFDGLPTWITTHCVLCLACLHRCPQKALQYGEKTSSRGRYVHPELK